MTLREFLVYHNCLDEMIKLRDVVLFEKEKWVCLNRFFDLKRTYFVSNYGRVVIKKENDKLVYLVGTKEWKRNRSDYYIRHSIWFNDIGRTKMWAHRLVALCFLRNAYNEDNDINHVFNISRFNYVGCLEVCTHKENVAHAVNTGRFEGFGVEVTCFDLDFNLITTYGNSLKAEHATGIPSINIRNCCYSLIDSDKNHVFMCRTKNYRWLFSKDVSYENIIRAKRMCRDSDVRRLRGLKRGII